VTVERATAARVSAALATWRTPDRGRAIAVGLFLVGLALNLSLVGRWPVNFDWFVDAQTWTRINPADPYAFGAGTLEAPGAFRYAPITAWLFYPASLVSWPAFVAAYLALSAGALWLMAGRRAALLVLAFPPVLLELVNGNVHLFLALAIWAGLRWPSAWAFVLLTKVTPGVGVAWFAGRREWRNLAIALGVTLAIAAVGYALAPNLWTQWFGLLGSWSSMTPPNTILLGPLAIRLPIAAALAWHAGRTGRAWLVPVACFLAAPVLWLQSTAILTASFPLWWDRQRWATGAPAEPAP
jgi:hypothetical protein